MDAFCKTIIHQQFGAAIDMLENAIRVCPDGLWSRRLREGGPPGFWYTVFHTLFYLDYYLANSPDGFVPPDPFTLDELKAKGDLPEQPYAKAELLKYLEHGRHQCRAAIESLTTDTARQACAFPRLEMSVAELLLYNMRHIQHHVGQLNVMLREETGSAPRWVKIGPR